MVDKWELFNISKTNEWQEWTERMRFHELGWLVKIEISGYGGGAKRETHFLFIPDPEGNWKTDQELKNIDECFKENGNTSMCDDCEYFQKYCQGKGEE